MIRFECDYAEGAHERILARMLETNMENITPMRMMVDVVRV